MNRVKFLSKITLAAIFGLALALTFSCSGNDDPDGLSSASGSGDVSSSSVTGGGGGSSGGGGILFNENSQIYNEDGSLFTGNGNLEMIWDRDCRQDGSRFFCTLYNSVIVGNVTNGIVNLKLPKNFPNEYMIDRMYCPDFKDYKWFFGPILLINDNEEIIGDLRIYNEIQESMFYGYFSKAEKIACNLQGEVEEYVFDFDVKEGWNNYYFRVENKTGVRVLTMTTNNILTKEVKYNISIEDRVSVVKERIFFER